MAVVVDKLLDSLPPSKVVKIAASGAFRLAAGTARRGK